MRKAIVSSFLADASGNVIQLSLEDEKQEMLKIMYFSPSVFLVFCSRLLCSANISHGRSNQLFRLSALIFGVRNYVTDVVSKFLCTRSAAETFQTW